jgi:16S rRNA (uracil1498-N3)-methyltransferase
MRSNRRGCKPQLEIGDGMPRESPKTRLYVPERLGPGSRLALTAAQAHRLGNVLRLAPGAAIAVFNGRDGEWLAEIARLSKKGAEVAIERLLAPPRVEADLWLLFAPIKRSPIDLVAEKASELGVTRLCPVITERTIVARVNLQRLEANAIEAAEQCGRTAPPVVVAPLPLRAVMADWDPKRRLILCDESGNAPPLAEVCAKLPAGPVAILVGPEGGFAPRELDRLHKLPFASPVSLGPRLLRADTAAIAALACWQAISGDWRRPAGALG